MATLNEDLVNYSYYAARGNGKTYFQKMLDETDELKLTVSSLPPSEGECKFEWISYDFGPDPQSITKIYYNGEFMEEKQMNKCDFELGDVVVVQDELCDVFNGKVIIAAPGYGFNNVEVVDNQDGKVFVIIKSNKDCTKDYEFEFDLDIEYVYDLTYNVRDGLIIIKAEYTIDSNVDIDEDL